MKTQMKKLNSTAKLVAMEIKAIATEMGTNKVHPTNAFLAERVERGNREITRALISLEEHGQIKVDIDPRRQPLRIIEILG